MAFVPPRAWNLSFLYSRYTELTMPQGALEALMAPVLAIHAQRVKADLSPLKGVGLLFAGDHSVAREYGVSAYPPEVTPQMVANIVCGGAAISCLAQRRNALLWVCDVAVSDGFDDLLSLVSNEHITFKRDPLHKKFPAEGYERGARDIVRQAALSPEAHKHCWDLGAAIAEEAILKTGCDFIFLGEMGIGNTTPASALSALLLEKSIEESVGRGTGLDERSLLNKQKIVRLAVSRARAAMDWRGVRCIEDAHTLLQQLGGAELSALAGAAWRAAEMGRYVLLDGLIVTAAVAPLAVFEKDFSRWLLASHESAEPVHSHLLKSLGLEPLLRLGLRLGEGSGAAIAAGLLQDADFLLRTMATFSSAGVSSTTLID